MTLNDFKAIEGDRQMGLRSLPVTMGPDRAAKLACVIMTVPQVAAIVLILGGQLAAMRVLLRDPEGKTPWYQGVGILLYITGMMIAAIALRDP